MAERNSPSTAQCDIQDQMLLDHSLKEDRKLQSELSSTNQALSGTWDADPLEADTLMDEYKVISERNLLARFVHRFELARFGLIFNMVVVSSLCTLPFGSKRTIFTTVL